MSLWPARSALTSSDNGHWSERMIGLMSYLFFLGLLGLVMRVALKAGRDGASANAAAAMLSARLH